MFSIRQRYDNVTAAEYYALLYINGLKLQIPVSSRNLIALCTQSRIKSSFICCS